MTTVRIRRRTETGWVTAETGRPVLLSQQWLRLRRFYDKYDTSQWMDHERLGRRAVVARRKPRAGRRRS